MFWLGLEVRRPSVGYRYIIYLAVGHRRLYFGDILARL